MKTFNELRDGELCGYCLKTDRGKQSEIHSSSGVSLCEGFYCEDAYRTYIEETTDDMNQTSKEIELITKFVNEGAHVYGGEIRKERVLSYLKRLLVVSNKEYESNKHYIELGKAVEKAFDEGFSINQLHSVLSNINYCLYDAESLLNWAEGRE